MIRTGVVELSVIPAVAYRQKLPSGGSGVVIVRRDCKQPGIASISRTSGEAIPTANNPAGQYPAEAFAEAIKLTAGLPYKKRGGITLKEKKFVEAPVEEVPELKEEEIIVDSAEYQKLVDAYTDKNGRLSYALLNRALIKFAHSSSKVRAMIADGAALETVRDYIVGTKYRAITGNHDLTDAQIGKLSELLDEVSPKGVFRELNDELRKKLKAVK